MAAPQAQQHTLLIVDDDEGPQKALQVVFRGLYNVITAFSGEEALGLIGQQSIDVAILDIHMAGMSGIQLLEKIKMADPSIEAIMLTGYETLETIRQALRLGACDYLSKPFDIDTIRAAVSNAIERRSFSAELNATHQKMTSLQVDLKQQAINEEITRNKGEIYASILHDINGPLTIIAGYVQLINSDLDARREFAGRQIEELKDHLRLINRQVTHCVDISQRYLGFLRRRPREQSTTAVSKAFQDLALLLKGHPSSASHQLIIENPAEALAVAMNGADFVQILLNLTINGFQSTAVRHAVTIRAEACPPSFDPQTIALEPTNQLIVPADFRPASQFVRVTVQDDGPGIPPATLARIFEPYFTTKPNSGTGLGLCIVQRLVKQANGVLHVHSELNRGTAFHIYLAAG